MSGEGDKRKVSTDALETLGNIITENEKRDAIHLAVIPMQAQCWLTPGQHVGADGTLKDPVGIVDPFLAGSVRPGEWFWLVIYPRMINSLRHVWTHPAFAEEASAAHGITKADAEERLREICAHWDGPDYDMFLEVATTGEYNGGEDFSANIDGEYLNTYGSDSHGDIPSEVWDLVEIITGKKVVGRPTYFSCSC